MAPSRDEWGPVLRKAALWAVFFCVSTVASVQISIALVERDIAYLKEEQAKAWAELKENRKDRESAIRELGKEVADIKNMLIMIAAKQGIDLKR
jgi:hypothetical protein